MHLGTLARSGQEEGTRVRDGLRLGVTDALLTLWVKALCSTPPTRPCASALQDGELSKDAYFQQLLRLIYRLIFVFSVEERGLLHPKDDSAARLAARAPTPRATPWPACATCACAGAPATALMTCGKGCASSSRA
jgi:hypothetical protein